MRCSLSAPRPGAVSTSASMRDHGAGALVARRRGFPPRSSKPAANSATCSFPSICWKKRIGAPGVCAPDGRGTDDAADRIESLTADRPFFGIVQGAAAQPRIRSVPSPAVAIAVAAEDVAIRLKIAGALSGRSDLAVRSGASVAEVVGRGTSPDLIVCRSESSRSDALESFKELKHDLPELLIVVVLDSADARITRRLLDIGIDGLVLTDQVQAALPPTIDAALAGQMAMPRVLRAHAYKRSLSVRERQILAMVVMGFSNGEIGARIFLAESTVKSHLSSAYAKLGVRSRSEAVALILDPQGSLGTGILAITPDAPR